MIDYEIDDELLTCFHQPASLSDSISYEDSRLSMNQKIIVSYSLLDIDGKYGFNQDFSPGEIHGYFSQMKTHANVSMNEIIDTLTTPNISTTQKSVAIHYAC